MTAAELTACLAECSPDAAVRIVGSVEGGYDIFAAYRGEDGTVYVIVAQPAAKPEHPSCGTDACCGTC